MLTGEWSIAIPGKPATRGSMKCVGRRGKVAHVLVESHATADPWRQTVVGWMRKYHPAQTAEKGQAVGVEITFTLPRPATHYGTGRNSKRLKESAPKHPTGRNTGDIDKLARLILDAMQDAQLIPDDAAVCELNTRKAYPADHGYDDRLPYPGVLIRLYPHT